MVPPSNSATRVACVVLCALAWGAAAADGPTIDVFYGSTQRFGTLGVPQRWVNIPGRVSSPAGVQWIKYSLNGGAFRDLSIGGNARHKSPQNFNVEIDYLWLAAGANTVLLRALDGQGRTTDRTVTLHYDGGPVVPAPDYTIDWDAVANVNDAAHVVDGVWILEDGGVRVVPPAYDRLIAVGDLRWQTFELTVAFTANVDWGWFGVMLGWKGHTDIPLVCAQPHCGWEPHANSVWYQFSPDHLEGPGGMPDSIGGSLSDPAGTLLLPHRKYVFKIRAEGGNFYRFKLWAADDPEPWDWSDTGFGHPYVTPGAVLLVANYLDMTWHEVRFRPLPDVEPPSAPEGLVATGGSGSRIDLVWEPAEDDLQVTEYRVFRDGAYVGSTSVPSFSDHGLPPSTHHEYRVTARDDSENESLPSDAAGASTLPATPGGICEATGYGDPLAGGSALAAASGTCYLRRITVDCEGLASGARAKLRDVWSRYYGRAAYVLYDDDGPAGEPSSLLARTVPFYHEQSNGQPLVVERPWIEPPLLEAGAYWLGICTQSNAASFYVEGLAGGTTRRDPLASWAAGPRATWRHAADTHATYGDLLAQLVFSGECPGCVPVPCGESPLHETPCSAGLGACAVEGVRECEDPDSVDESPECDAVPGVPVDELCGNGVDEDCDGETDEGDALDAATWYADADGDGHGSAGAPVSACERPDGHVATDDDCDDAAATTFPGATEYCGDGRDNDCDGSVDPAGCTPPGVHVAPGAFGPGAAAAVHWGGFPGATATDWIGWYAPGAAPGAWIDWLYSGSCGRTAGGARPAGSCPLPVAATSVAGTFEARLYASNSYTLRATSPPFTVHAPAGGPTVEASAGEVEAGDPLAVAWSGISGAEATDWLAIYAVGAAHTTPRDWLYVGCTRSPTVLRPAGSCAFSSLALGPGTYEPRLFAANGYTLLATGDAFTIVPPGGAATLAAGADEVAPGGTLDVSWSGIPAPAANDWIGLFTTGAADGAYVQWRYVSCTTSPTVPRSSGSCAWVLPGALAAGTYELRLFQADGFTRLATSDPFEVVPPAGGTTLAVTPASTSPGGSVTATWNAIPSAASRDWIGLFVPGAPSSAFLDWFYTSCSRTPGAPRASGSCVRALPSSLAPRSYELRLFADDEHALLATSVPFQVAVPGGPTISANASAVEAGASVEVTWSGIATPSARDWIGFFALGAPNSAFAEWFYVSCTRTAGTPRASGTCPLVVPSGLAPGTYELRLFANNGYTLLAASAPIALGP